ncbi:hypothetical protein [Massilia luteola]|uniref:hypothetical protein n=1 Tax=Massilia luteola TaxID=3081751 RepID=UPI002ACC0E69|nr:hypothetical protein [Massilia sp. Gc5]
MVDWSEGYMAEIGYTFGYYPALNPARLKLAFLNAGHAFPDVGTACELGAGQGLSVNIHAAPAHGSTAPTSIRPRPVSRRNSPPQAALRPACTPSRAKGCCATASASIHRKSRRPSCFSSRRVPDESPAAVASPAHRHLKTARPVMTLVVLLARIAQLENIAREINVRL